MTPAEIARGLDAEQRKAITALVRQRSVPFGYGQEFWCLARHNARALFWASHHSIAPTDLGRAVAQELNKEAEHG